MSDNHHTSKNFDLELESLRTRVLQMGGLAEQQVRRAIDGLYSGDTPLLEAVISDDDRVNQMEIEGQELQMLGSRQGTSTPNPASGGASRDAGQDQYVPF